MCVFTKDFHNINNCMRWTTKSSIFVIMSTPDAVWLSDTKMELSEPAIESAIYLGQITNIIKILLGNRVSSILGQQLVEWFVVWNEILYTQFLSNHNWNSNFMTFQLVYILDIQYFDRSSNKSCFCKFSIVLLDEGRGGIVLWFSRIALWLK